MIIFLAFFSFFSFCFGASEDVAFEKPVLSKDNVGVILLSGDVNVSYNFFHATDNGVEIPYNTTSGNRIELFKIWELEMNFFVHYVYRQTFSSVNLRFDNNMGTQGGTDSTISLRRAFVGYHLIYQKPIQLDLIVGRQVLSDMFDSQVQFNNTTIVDGVFGEFKYPFKSGQDIGARFALIVYNFVDGHYSFVGQLGYNPMESAGFFFKYSLAHWRKKGLTTIYDLTKNNINGQTGEPFGKVLDNPRYRFIISQFLLGYTFKLYEIPIKIYGAYLINHVAKKAALFNHKKKNNGFYIGTIIGQSDGKNAYSIEIVYQNVGAQTIPDWDVSGIGTGNPRFNTVYGPLYDDFTGLLINPTQFNTNGNVNYKGFEVDFKYGISDNIQLEVTYNFTNNEDKSIGPIRHYRDLEVTLHYYW